MKFGRHIWHIVPLFSLFFISLSIHNILAISISKRICRICKQSYQISNENNNNSNNRINIDNEKPCLYHPGRWIGAELSKHYGSRSGGQLKGLAVFWDCCDSENQTDPGCRRGVHKSYDEDDSLNYFINRRDS